MTLLHAGGVGLVAEAVFVLAGVALSVWAAWVAFVPSRKVRRRRDLGSRDEDSD